MTWILLSSYMLCLFTWFGGQQLLTFKHQYLIFLNFFDLHVFPLSLLYFLQIWVHKHTRTHLPCGFGLDGVLVKVRHYSFCHHQLPPVGLVIHDKESEWRHIQLLLWQVLWDGRYSVFVIIIIILTAIIVTIFTSLSKHHGYGNSSTKTCLAADMLTTLTVNRHGFNLTHRIKDQVWFVKVRVELEVGHGG